MELIGYIGIGLIVIGVLYILDRIFDIVLNWVCKYLVIRFDMRTDIYGRLYSELDDHQKNLVDFRGMIVERILISVVLLITILIAVSIVGMLGYGVSRAIGL